jgi:hypothetical protein
MYPIDKGVEVRARLTKAFTSLRKMGFIARQNFLCCQGCACSQLSVIVANNPKVFGVLHYNKQEGERLRNYGSVMLSFDAKSEKEEDAKFVGKIIFETLKLFGLLVSWNGCTDEKIKVLGVVKP